MHFQSGVKTIFDGVVRTTRHVFGNERPFLTICEKQVHQPFVFLESPFILCDVWVEMIVPSFATLFAYPAWEHRCNEVPSLCTVLDDKTLKLLIFLFRPRRLGSSLALILLLQTHLFQFLVNWSIFVFFISLECWRLLSGQVVFIRKLAIAHIFRRIDRLVQLKPSVYTYLRFITWKAKLDANLLPVNGLGFLDQLEQLRILYTIQNKI